MGEEQSQRSLHPGCAATGAVVPKTRNQPFCSTTWMEARKLFAGARALHFHRHSLLYLLIDATRHPVLYKQPAPVRLPSFYSTNPKLLTSGHLGDSLTAAYGLLLAR